MQAIHSCVVALLAAFCVPSLALAQTPQYRTEFLGETDSGGGVLDLNNSGIVTGVKLVAGNQRAFVVAHGLALTLLPLPAGRLSSTSTEINDQGVIIGAVGAAYSPEFAGKAAVWTPNGSGGYVVQELGALPGHTASNATAQNNVGDIAGWSFDGTYRIPVLFFTAGGPQSLQSTGVFDPQSINDARVLVDRSADGKLLDLNTMTVTSLGVPTGFPIHYTAVTSTHINALGQVGAVAFLSTSGSCVQQVARHTNGIGWEIFGPCSISGGVGDMNNLGEMSMVWTATSLVQLNQYGPVTIDSLLSAPVGQWFSPLYSIYRLNNAHQLAGWAYNTTTNQIGVVLLTPDGGAGTPYCFGDGLGSACPCGNHGLAGNGCGNSLNGFGANLSAAGTASLSADSVVLYGSGMPNSSALYFQGTTQSGGGLGTPFGDGLRCAGGLIVRLDTRANALGASQYPGAGDASVSARGLVTTPGTRNYQIWYRNAAAFCTASTFNLSNGLSVAWTL